MANEITVAEKLKTLYQLQLIDAQIGEIEVLKGELPMEVSDLEDDIVGLETRLEKTVNSVKELQTTMSRYVANIKEAEALKIKYKTQLDNVKNNREYEALSKEIEHPWSAGLVKELIWRPVQLSFLREESTKKLSSKNINEIYDIINRYLGEKFGIYIEFPNINNLIDYDN